MPLDQPSQLRHSHNLHRRLGVRAFLFLVLGLSSGLPLLYFSWAQVNRAAEHEIEVTDRQTVAAAFSAADQMQQAMRDFTRTAEAFSAQLAIPGRVDPDAIIASARAYTTHHPEFIGAYVADARGVALVLLQRDGDFSNEPIDYSDREYIQTIKAKKQTAISRVAIGRFSRQLSVQVAAPILSESNELLGITCSSVDLTAVAEQAKQSVRGLSGGRVVIVDGEGKQIADSTGGPIPAQKDLSAIAIYRTAAPSNFERRIGIDDHGHFVRGTAVGLSFPAAGWRVIAMTPQLEIDAQAQRMKHHAQMLGGLLILAALVSSALLSTVIARPLRLLAETAKAVTSGELHREPRFVRGIPREFAELTLAMRGMIQSLRSHTEKLEAQVLLRTNELHLANTELENALSTINRIHENTQADIEKARIFQQRMLPRVIERGDLDIAVHYAPLKRVSGDIFDIFEVSRNHIRFFVADATGHGVQASMRTLLLKAAYDRIKTHHGSPNAVLSVLNTHWVNEFPDGDFHCAASCIDVRLTATGADVVYANAACAPLYVLSTNSTREIYSESALLGVDIVTFPEPTQVQLAHGELLLMTTDGLVEQMNPRHERFDLELSSFALTQDDTAGTAIRRICQRFEAFRESVMVQDDVTLVAARMR